MRVLLDECVPIQLKREFAEFDARTVRDMRWQTIKNGALLRRAAEEFQAVLTVDVGMVRCPGLSGRWVKLPPALTELFVMLPPHLATSVGEPARHSTYLSPATCSEKRSHFLRGGLPTGLVKLSRHSMAS